LRRIQIRRPLGRLIDFCLIHFSSSSSYPLHQYQR
jgi:hypothetical protein